MSNPVTLWTMPNNDSLSALADGKKSSILASILLINTSIPCPEKY